MTGRLVSAKVAEGMLYSRLIVRRIRLGSGLILLLFVACHLCNLAVGLVSVDAMERWRSALLIPWQTNFGQALLLAVAVMHAGLGFASLASRHSLAMSRTDWAQLLLGLELGAPGYDPFGRLGANFNLLIGSTAVDPVSGTASHRSHLCEIRRTAPV